MLLTDFDYDLPPDLIAQEPLPDRVSSRLLLVDPAASLVGDRRFTDLVSLTHPGDLLVFNDTLVIPARLFGHKRSGGKVEVLVERVLDPATLLAHLRSSKSPKPGAGLVLEDAIACEVTGRRGDLFVLRQRDGDWLELLERHGHVPLPPYIRRVDGSPDRERYQTVFASKPGAVAAPTAGLHFDEAMIARLRDRGVGVEHITLHVGAGTFQPIRAENIDTHIMHTELVEVSAAACERINETRREGGRVIAVGTTVVRSLESAVINGKLRPFHDESSLFIKPGFEFKVVDALLTNFHLPRSTLLILVSAFAGIDLIRRAYRHAVQRRYRFFSYGDAMFIANRHRWDN